MKRYKFKENDDDYYSIDNTKENRDMFIRMIAEDYADWMATAHDAYVNQEHSHEFTKGLFMKSAMGIAKAASKRNKTVDDLHEYREDMLSRIFRLKKKLGI
jgi:hypothetical protein